ncbi:MAG: XRE family transcriptional regulator [Oscillospiraceae bacterium]|jgi:hypothetical protein|nr:XRE family transcriptional regulator [Oscillospiraceae bacterium]
MAEYTSFGLAVKTKLLGPPSRTQAWLVDEVRAATGLYVDGAYISKILTGQRNAPKIVQAIREILNLPEQEQDSA